MKAYSLLISPGLSVFCRLRFITVNVIFFVLKELELKAKGGTEIYNRIA